MSLNSFMTLSELKVENKIYKIFDLSLLKDQDKLNQLPFSIKILIENLLRNENSNSITKEDIESLINWNPQNKNKQEISFTPSRVLLQDFTGVPAIVDLAAMRDAMQKLGGDPKKINPIVPVDLVIDHSVMVDYFGDKNALNKNIDLEFDRNKERYLFLKWGQKSFNNFRVVPPGSGIVHQVNLEYLAKVIWSNDNNYAYPDTQVGTDSHTTMINGLGVLGWGVGGIEAEAAMLNQPITMLVPDVIGFEITGKLEEGTTATDLVLTIVQILRSKNVVGKFVEFYGVGLDQLPVADRATIANMAPEYGATCGIFPIDNETLKYLKLSARTEEEISLVENYAKQTGLFRNTNDNGNNIKFTDTIKLDLSTIEPCIAGPKRPQDKIVLKNSKLEFLKNMQEQNKTTSKNNDELDNGSIVIAAITSCTNTSNPDVMLTAGLVAKNAIKHGLHIKPWVKTSLAPGSKVVIDYLDKAGLSKYLNQLNFNLVGFGCTTCIGNSGPLDPTVSEEIKNKDLSVCAVLSGNRNFEGRVHPEVKNAYLASPPLVVAYALAGSMNFDFSTNPLGYDQNNNPIYLKDIWPTRDEIQEIVQSSLKNEMFTKRYSEIFSGDKNWQNLHSTDNLLYNWDNNSNYIKHPPYFFNIQKKPLKITNIVNAKVLIKLGNSITTDHISPASSIAEKSPAGEYLTTLGIKKPDFNSYGSRRGNHEIMVRGTFANSRLKNQLAPDTEGSWTTYIESNKQMSIFKASELYAKNNVPLIVLAGKEYGTGSSRDWAAKGPALLGVKAVIAESFERIHRSNLIGMGILPLEFIHNENTNSLNLNGTENYSIILDNIAPSSKIEVTVMTSDKKQIIFSTTCRIDTPQELEYYKHGGILQYVLRSLL